MDEELISKKELLELTGISYGQLYRWKRKGLIPEDWFIRKSTYTGQETFFPRSQMLTRVGRILNMKEDASLDDLADVFSPEPGPSAPPTAEDLKARGIVSADVMRLFMDGRDKLSPPFRRRTARVSFRAGAGVGRAVSGRGAADAGYTAHRGDQIRRGPRKGAADAQARRIRVRRAVCHRRSLPRPRYAACACVQSESGSRRTKTQTCIIQEGL